MLQSSSKQQQQHIYRQWSFLFVSTRVFNILYDKPMEDNAIGDDVILRDAFSDFIALTLLSICEQRREYF